MYKAPKHGTLSLHANPYGNEKVTGQWAACHKYSSVASNNSNVDVSYFISMISYLHCTDTNEKHPQVHSTLNIFTLKIYSFIKGSKSTGMSM